MKLQNIIHTFLTRVGQISSPTLLANNLKNVIYDDKLIRTSLSCKETVSCVSSPVFTTSGDPDDDDCGTVYKFTSSSSLYVY